MTRLVPDVEITKVDWIRVNGQSTSPHPIHPPIVVTYIMPRATRAAKIKADANIASTSHSLDDDDDDEANSTLEEEDGEPPTKKAKGKGKAKATGRTVSKRFQWEDIQKPPLHRKWKDIPDWKKRTDSPLMDLPVEIMDKIFCVRPELDVSLSMSISSGFSRR